MKNFLAGLFVAAAIAGAYWLGGYWAEQRLDVRDLELKAWFYDQDDLCKNHEALEIYNKLAERILTVDQQVAFANVIFEKCKMGKQPCYMTNDCS